MQLTPATAQGSRSAPAARRSTYATSTTRRSTSATAPGTCTTCSRSTATSGSCSPPTTRARGTSTAGARSGEAIQFPETRAYVDRVEHLTGVYRDAWGQRAGPAMTDDRTSSSSRRTRTPTRRSGRPTSGSSPTATCSGSGRGDEPGWNVAQRFRLRAGELDEVRAEIHAHLRRAGGRRARWEVGSQCDAGDLVERLLRARARRRRADAARGRDGADRAAGAPPPAGVEVRRAESDEELLDGRPDRRGRVRRPGADRCANRRRRPDNVDLPRVPRRQAGRARPPARSRSTASTLFGGATLPEARGRGAYRALVAARWDDAVARGTPVLVTQAGAMSRPILATLGFREVCEDPVDLAASTPSTGTRIPARAGLGQGRLRDPGDGRARGRAAGGPSRASGSPRRRRSRSSSSRTSWRPAQRRARAQPARGGRRLLAGAAAPTRSTSPT